MDAFSGTDRLEHLRIWDGVTAQAVEGERTTRTLPGRAEGRDRVRVEIDEVWTSSELNLTMLAKHVDADGVETVTSVTHLDRSEPSATLFQIPRDYTVQRESGAQ